MHYIQAKSLLSASNGINIYRGCTHGCIYCDSRSTVYRMDHPFEDVAVKENAPALLEEALARKRRRCMIGFGAMSDPYLPLEKDLGLTRRCLELIANHRFGVSVITKSDLILRDLDLLTRINETAKTVVSVTITTADDDLCRKIEPHVCPTSRRTEVLEQLHDAGIPTIVWFCPVLPFINDTKENLDDILAICRDTHVYGLLYFGMGLTLRDGNRDYFYEQLDRLFPGMKERYQQAFGSSYGCMSLGSAKLSKNVPAFCHDAGIVCDQKALFSYMNELDTGAPSRQTTLF